MKGWLDRIDEVDYCLRLGLRLLHVVGLMFIEMNQRMNAMESVVDVTIALSYNSKHGKHSESWMENI